MSKAMTRKAWLEYLQKAVDEFDWDAVEQQQGEPVACERCKQLEEQAYDILGDLKVANLKLSVWSQRRTWVGLTEDEAIELLPVGDWEVESTLEFAKAVEAKLKEKNT